MRYIESFANDAAIQAAVENESLGKPYIALNDETHKIDWDTKFDPRKVPMTFEIVKGGVLRVSGKGNNSVGFSYSKNNTAYVSVSTPATINLDSGDTISFIFNLNATQTQGGNTKNLLFSCDNNLDTSVHANVYGNLCSIIYGSSWETNTGTTMNRQMRETFKNSYINGRGFCILDATKLISPSTVGANSYREMFAGQKMMVKSPCLPAENLEQACYFEMFSGCTALKEITCLATYIPQNLGSTTDWVKGVPSGGTFKKAASMTGWTTGTSGIPSGWTVIDAT